MIIALPPVMDESTARDRLQLSRRVVTRWIAMGGPGGPHEDKMRMIREETQIIAKIARDHPDLADEARMIGELFGDLANRLTPG